MKLIKTTLTASIVAAVAACAQTPETTVNDTPAATPVVPATAAIAAPVASNPFAEPSGLPYLLPPFDKISNADFRPGFEAGMAEQRKEIDAIAHNPEAPSFDNTMVAMERSGRMLDRVNKVFFNLSSSNTNDEIDKIQEEMAPKLTAHQDAIFLDPALFARVKSIYDQRTSLGLDAESLRLVERYHTQFIRAGAPLAESDKVKLRSLNEKLSSLETQFQQTVLKGANAGAVIVDSVSELDGLSPQQIAAAAEAAKAADKEGKWLIPLRNTTGQPPLTTLKNRALRERIYKASLARGIGGPNDTTVIVAQLVKLRAERAKLLGYPNHAAYVLEDETAHTPAAVNKLLSDLGPPALVNAKKEAAEIQKLIDAQAKAAHAPSFKLQAWDWAYYAEQVRKAKYAYDESQVKPYFEMNHVLLDGVFFAAHELYGLSFKERTDLPVYHKDVRVFEVFNADGSKQGLILIDYFARSNKQGGAWMNAYVDQSALLGTSEVVVNNLNIPKPPDGEPVLMTFAEVTTAFHEFGHGLHGLFSNVKYPYFSGANVPRDFVEYPSQYNEMWASDPKVLANYAKHYQTGEPMPQALVDKVLAAGKFNQGFVTTEYVAASMLDQNWHQISAAQAPEAKDVIAFEMAALKKDGEDFGPIPPRYRSTYFSHIFSNGYSAGYYAYLWSDVLAVDTEHWFKTHGGLNRANGDYLRAKVLSRGGSVDCSQLFQDFYGQGPDIAPLLEHRGLTLKH